ncbi:MAG: hypothetical protein M3370_02450 [Actinomycetota bacterium]|nr:hypothetical protein [Actinomycetota bacterium]
MGHLPARGDGRDEGPLANPAHYLILFGLFGIFTAGTLAIALPRGERPGPAALRITRDWHAPVGGLLIVACSGFALAGFPLDDVWHRLFGQDVTLWGPTHLMLIGGAGLTLIGMALLMAEGARARPAPAGEGRGTRVWAWARKIGLMGGGLRVDALEKLAPGVFRSTQPVPVGGPWKSSVRLHLDRALLGVPLHLPADPAIPAPEVAAAASFERPAQQEIEILQRERKEGVGAWLWTAANIAVGTVALALILALGWGLGRAAGAGQRHHRGGPPPPAAGVGPSGGRTGPTLDETVPPPGHVPA